MGTDILPGHTYTDGEFVNGPSLTEHVSEATIQPTFYSSRAAKTAAELTDELLVRDVGDDNYQRVTLSVLQGLLVGSGSVIQTQYAEYTANSNLTAIIPYDDTIPQNTEGTQIVQATITPIYAASRILVRFQGTWSASLASTALAAALFRDVAASALCTAGAQCINVNFRQFTYLEYLDSPSSTSPLVYKIRVGPHTASTVRFNGTSVGREFGGTARTTLTLQEIK